MTQETTCLKAIDSIKRMVEITEVQQDIIYQHLLMVYAAGNEAKYKRAGKRVIQLKHGIEKASFASIKEAAMAVDCDASNISKVLRGKHKICRGYEWKLSHITF